MRDPATAISPNPEKCMGSQSIYNFNKDGCSINDKQSRRFRQHVIHWLATIFWSVGRIEMLFSAWQYHTGAGPMTDGPLQAFQLFSTAWPAIQMLTDARAGPVTFSQNLCFAWQLITWGLLHRHIVKAVTLHDRANVVITVTHMWLFIVFVK